MEGTGRYIFRMEFDPDALGNDKMLLDGVDDLLYAVRRQGRSAAAEVQAGDGLFSGNLASCQVDLPDQGVDVPAACFLGVEGLAVGTEAADAPAEGDMDVQPQAVTVRKGQLLNIFQIRFQHVQDDPGLSLEDQGVFCHKEIAALAAQVRDRDAAAAGGEGPVFHDHALAAGSGEASVDQIGKGAF